MRFWCDGSQLRFFDLESGMPERINDDRRRFLGGAAMTLLSANLGFLGARRRTLPQLLACQSKATCIHWPAAWAGSILNH